MAIRPVRPRFRRGTGAGGDRFGTEVDIAPYVDIAIAFAAVDVSPGIGVWQFWVSGGEG